MSGYLGGDCGSEHALDIAQNAIHAASSLVHGDASYIDCQSCFKEIPEARRDALALLKMPCKYCIHCQDKMVKAPKIKMLDRIL